MRADSACDKYKLHVHIITASPQLTGLSAKYQSTWKCSTTITNTRTKTRILRISPELKNLRPYGNRYSRFKLKHYLRGLNLLSTETCDEQVHQTSLPSGQKIQAHQLCSDIHVESCCPYDQEDSFDTYGTGMLIRYSV